MEAIKQYAVVATKDMEATSALLHYMRESRTMVGDDLLPAFEVRQLDTHQEVFLLIDGDDYIRLHNMMFARIALWYKISTTVPQGWGNVYTIV